MSFTTQQNPFTAWTMPPGFIPDVKGFADRMLAMPKVVQALQSVKTGATPARVTYTEDKLRVLRYESDAPRKYATPLLMVFALVNRPYILDLLPHKSVVRHFLDAGFDVYLVDWGVPTDGDKHQTVGDYVDGYLNNVVDHVREISGQEQISLLGYCMGGTLSAMYTALYQEKIRNLIMMAAPVDWSERKSLLTVWCDEKYFDIDKILDVFGNAPPEWLQGSFALLKPVDNLVGKYITFYEKMTDEKFLTEFFAMETWVNDNIPVAGETFRAFVKYGFQQNLLVQGRFPVGRRYPNLADITCPLLNLTATNDHLVPCGQSAPLNDLVSSRDRKLVSFDAGHIGLAVGGRAQRELWPRACDWLAERSDPI